MTFTCPRCELPVPGPSAHASDTAVNAWDDAVRDHLADCGVCPECEGTGQVRVGVEVTACRWCEEE